MFENARICTISCHFSNYKLWIYAALLNTFCSFSSWHYKVLVIHDTMKSYKTEMNYSQTGYTYSEKFCIYYLSHFILYSWKKIWEHNGWEVFTDKEPQTHKLFELLPFLKLLLLNLTLLHPGLIICSYLGWL